MTASISRIHIFFDRLTGVFMCSGISASAELRTELDRTSQMQSLIVSYARLDGQRNNLLTKFPNRMRNRMY